MKKCKVCIRKDKNKIKNKFNGSKELLKIAQEFINYRENGLIKGLK